MAIDWTKEEVAAIVPDYFEMLQSELNKEQYNKTRHRLKLIEQIKNRSEGAIEFKHQNISAVLAEMGIPFIKGYKPRSNYQQLLVDEITDYLSENRNNLEVIFKKFSEEIVETNISSLVNFDLFLEEEPEASIVNEKEPTYRPIKINYLEREQSNRNLGEDGERLIIEYEKWRLIKAGKESLADKIEWVSKDLGDGTGFDILSKNENGTDRFIEVKTTKLTKETPIFVTKNEVNFSKKNSNNFFLYRLYNFDSSPKFFMKNGSYEAICLLKPETFKGFF